MILRAATPADVPALSRLAISSFVDAFGYLYSPADLAAFIADALSEPRIAAELANPARLYRLAEQDGALTAFCKLGLTCGFPTNARGHHVLELKQLYAASVATVAVTLPLVLRSAARVSGDLIAVISSRFGEGKGRFQRALATLRECITTCAAASACATWTVFSFAIALHILGAIGLWLAAEAAHANVPLHAFLWVWPLMIVVHMLPLSFGGLGVREITLIYVLSTLYSTSAESVLLLSMIALFATTLFSLAGGIWNSFGAAGSGKDSA